MKLPKIFLLVIFCSFSISLLYGQKVKGNGKVVTEIRDISSFHSLSIGGACDIILTQGNRPSLKVETDANLQDLVETEVINGVLSVTNKEKFSHSTKLILHLIVKDLTSINVGGAANISSTNTLTSDQLEISIGGAANLDLTVEGDRFKAAIAGAGTAKLCGSVAQASFDIRGSGDIKAYCLKAEYVEVDVKGMGSAKVHASKRLEVDISGMGSVSYQGAPEVSKSISGMGSLSRN